MERTHQCNSLRDNIPEKVPWDEKELRKRQSADNKCKEIRDRLLAEPSGPLPKEYIKFRIINGVIYVLRNIKRGNQEENYIVPYIPESLMKRAFALIHEETTAGHRGFERTMKTFIRNFYNYQETSTVKKFCEECESCIKAKSVAKLVPVKTFPIPERPFQTISSDILGPLPITEQGNQYILVIRDYTTRYTLLSALKHKTADNIIKALRAAISNYGSSEVLVTDNAQEYVSEKLRNFCKFFNIKKVETAPYHPASQGISERINREINKILRIYADTLATTDWDELLPVIQLCLNNTYNASIRESPFYALYGYDSFTETLQSPKVSYDESDFALRMKRITSIRRLCREKLLEAQGKYTEFANKDRKPKDFKIGQRVFAKLKKFKPHQKLDLPISGPFIITGKKGQAFLLHEIKTRRTWIVHPDFIIGNKIGTADTNVKSEEGNLGLATNPAPQPVPRSNTSRYNLRPRPRS